MARIVYKYSFANSCMIEVKGSDPVVVLVGPDPQGTLCVWIEHGDTLITDQTHAVLFYGTGQKLTDRTSLNHLGSFVKGEHVWHAYSPTLRKAP